VLDPGRPRRSGPPPRPSGPDAGRCRRRRPGDHHGPGAGPAPVTDVDRDALADHRPFVLVVDSTRFKVSPHAAGRSSARYLLDRWPDVAFVHLEPYRYSVVADTAVLDGSLDAPTLTGPAEAWGVGGQPWGTKSMPWVFVVDGTGTVRASYQGIVGTEDVDVILAMIADGH
jgi:hypothetical protein